MGIKNLPKLDNYPLNLLIDEWCINPELMKRAMLEGRIFVNLPDGFDTITVSYEEAKRFEEETINHPADMITPRKADETKSIESLLKLVAVMAVKGYGRNSPEQAAAAIISDVKSIGMDGICDNTVRSWLKKAGGYVPRDEKAQ